MGFLCSYIGGGSGKVQEILAAYDQAKDQGLRRSLNRFRQGGLGV